MAGKEFFERQGCLVEIINSSHGMCASSRSFSLFFGDFVRNLGHVMSGADLDM